MKKFAINQERCDHSPKCLVRRECPAKAVQEVDGSYYIDMGSCRGCGLCVGVCPRGTVEESQS
ncbi:MAG: 4Fe-4S binding protein [Firmicutes bacterium]|jgi:indolepyruvate ferredoxin oxidoreductase alpha subunit|nr:4Fe-4S binding protein [Dethiobacter sp.]MBS4009110.1 4Fe-4S binding protein [Clostridium sp.]MCL5992887.1 4Fe-4S binding protein [Bacillota bacterium]